MTEPTLISPLLDNFIMGDPISNHHGVRCCPAIKKDTDEKYIVKIISVPASQTQLDAMLLTGAFPDEASALSYYNELADGVRDETKILAQLSSLEGFLPYEDLQIVQMDGQTGYDVYLLSPYKRSLSRHFKKNPLTHLGAINLGLDLCASLAVCRRSGYLYIDLKPNNVFVTGEKEFRIGDIGFVKLDSLKYASLPDKYRSAYTAPEISDAFSALNTTIDIYAVGLILYQAYNNGELPFAGETAPAEAFQPPMFADYELSEIILKACAPNPEDRWADPIQMGQALVSYMQRNGANDTPIVPVPEESEDEEASKPEEPSAKELESDADNVITESTEGTESEISQTEFLQDEQQIRIEDNTDISYAEDSEGNLTFLTDLSEADSADDQDIPEDSYGNITEEVSDILSQADLLAAHPVPDPVVAPEPIDVPVPESISTEEPVTEDSDDFDEPAEANETDAPEEAAEANETDAPEEVADDIDRYDDPVASPTKTKRRWIPLVIAAVFLLALIAGGIFYYNNYYLQAVESIVVEGEDDGLTVYVNSMISDDKLSVVCSDAYGNQLIMPVVDGKATFSKLVPNTGYSISVRIDGFHKLIGQTATAYSTPVQTTIVQFHAVTGSEDGSVILGFVVEGPDANHWKVLYSAAGEEDRSAMCTSHMVTLTGLTVGKEYTFTLVPDTDLYLAGTSQITFQASKLIYAQDLNVIGCVNNKLTAKWSAPDGITIDSWTVRCYNGNGYDKTIVTSSTVAEFDITDHASSYTVEVIADGMSVSQRAFVPENSVTASDFRAETTDFQTLTLSWNTNKEIPQEGWLLQYTISGTDAVWSVICKENSTRLTPVLPGTTYTFTLCTRDGVPFLSEQLICEVPAAPDFQGTFGGLEVGRKDLVFNMCKTPSVKNWTYKDVKASDFTTAFTVKQKASFLVKLNASYGSDSTEIDVLYLVRDADGNPVSSSLQTFKWGQMWSKYYCELDIPNMPKQAGSYTINVYFNGGIAVEQAFTVTE